MLDKELNSLSGRAVSTSRASANVSRDVDKMSVSAGKADRSINQLTGRLRLFADAAAILGPGTVPIGGVLAAGMAGFASQMGFAAIAGGVLVGSMQGMGDALSALNDAHLEPTADNLAKVETALSLLSPAAADFAQEAYGMLPALRQIRDAGAEALFPGLTASLDDLERLAPTVARIFESVGGALGDIASDGAASMASDRWVDFFEFIATEAPQALSELASTIGSLTHGLSELWMAFGPLNSDVSGWLMDSAAAFDRWAEGLAQTDGFREFVDYIRTTGPQVADTFAALGDAVLQIVQAAAPLGGPTLAAIEGISRAIAALANSDLGTPLLAAASAMALFSRSAGLMKKASDLSLASLNPWALGIGAAAGLLLAVEQKADAAAGGLDRFNAAMKDGNVDEANAGIADMQKRLEELKGTDMASISFSSFGNLLEGKSVRDEIEETTRALEGSKGAVEALKVEQERAASSDAYHRSIEDETEALYQNIAAMRAKRDEALRSFSAQTNYSQSLLDAKKALEENGRAWNLNTEAGLKNRRIVESQASAWNELNRTQGQTPAQARVARKALEDTAMSLGATREEARRYAKQLMDIPNKLQTKIDADVNGAMANIDALERRLKSIADEDVFINVRRTDTGLGPTGSADGSTVPDSGKGYADRFLYLLADREEVISNRRKQADRYRPVLKAINADMPPNIIKGMLAEGGTTGGSGPKRRPYGHQVVIDNTAALELAIARLTDRTEHQTSQLERYTSQLDEWGSKMADVAKATIAGFNTGLFETQEVAGDPVWSAGAKGPRTTGGWLENLTTDIAGLNERASLQSQLASLGLSGDSLAALLSEGSNKDIAGLISSGQVGQYAALYAQRASLQGSVGGAAGQMAYGSEYAAQAQATAQMAATLHASEIQLINMNAQLEQHTALLAQVGERAGDAAAASVVTGGNKAARRRRRD